MVSLASVREQWRRPIWQSVLVGMVLFCCPGMFNAINGMGAGGSRAGNVSLVARANSALYATFAIVGLFSGTIINTVGPKIPLMAGGIGYAIYIGSFWSLDRGGPEGFVIAGGAILGTTAALLWAAQGIVVLSYPLEKNRSKHFALQWSLLGVGAAVGGLITLVQSLNSGAIDAVATSSYVAFTIVVLVGIALSTLLSNPRHVRRSDGTPVLIENVPTWREELRGLAALTWDKKILLLTPAFLASNWFYAYQFALNANYFSVRARALNSMLYWLSQTAGTFGISAILDLKRYRRRSRGIIGWIVVTCFVLATWIGGTVFQSTFTRADPSPSKDWVDSGWAGPFVLYIMYGMADAMFQCYCYWIMSAITNDPRRLARYAGWYKGIQSAGGALSFGINACLIPYMAELGICFGLQAASLPLILIVVWGITDTNYGKEATVIPPKDIVNAVGAVNAHDAVSEIHELPASSYPSNQQGLVEVK